MMFLSIFKNVQGCNNGTKMELYNMRDSVSKRSLIVCLWGYGSCRAKKMLLL